MNLASLIKIKTQNARSDSYWSVLTLYCNELQVVWNRIFPFAICIPLGMFPLSVKDTVIHLVLKKEIIRLSFIFTKYLKETKQKKNLKSNLIDSNKHITSFVSVLSSLQIIISVA